MKNTVDTTKISIRPIEKNIAKELIIKNHYSHTWTMCTVAFGIYYSEFDNFFGITDKLSGVIVYGYPVGRRVISSISPCIKKGEVIELTRLWIEDSLGKNSESFSVAQSFKWLRQNMPQIKIVVSYSDPEQNHLGIIYQSLNFGYQGTEVRKVKAWWMKFNDTDGWMHPRTIVSKYGTVKPKELIKIFPNGWEIKELKKKHRYIYILKRGDVRRQILSTLKHPLLPYPKLISLHEDEIIKITKENI